MENKPDVIMSDVIIRQQSNTHLVVSCNEDIHRELRELFTYSVANSKYHPMVKAKQWDGKKRLYDVRKGTLYLGLFDYLVKAIKTLGYTYESKIEIQEGISKQYAIDFCDSLMPSSGGTPIKHRDYQYDGVYHAINDKKKVIVCATGAGKTLIIYSIIRHLFDEVEGRILLLVPTISLVKQMFSDFTDYATLTDFSVTDNTHCISAGIDKNSKKRIFISTYQSIMNNEDDYFKQFDAVLVDEAHYVKESGTVAKAFVSILTKCTNAYYRLGFTGSMDGDELNELTLQGLLGKSIKIVESHELIERGELADLNIVMYELEHSTRTGKPLYFTDYPEEIDFLCKSKWRNAFITQLANHLKGNVLILFAYVDKHGNKLYEDLVKADGKDVHYIHGNVDVDERDDIRTIIESSNNNIIVGSYGTTSTGINIKNLHHIIFGSTTKSLTRVLQSIGRGLRLGKDKHECTVHDIMDIVTKGRKKNFSYQHGLKRIEIYKKQKFKYKIKQVRL